MYSDSDQPRGYEHSKLAASLLDEDADPGLLAYTLLALLFFGAQTGHGVDESLLEHALELERRAGPDSEKSSLVLIWYQCTDATTPPASGTRSRTRGTATAATRSGGPRSARTSRSSSSEPATGRSRGTLVEQSCAELEPVGSDGPARHAVLDASALRRLRRRTRAGARNAACRCSRRRGSGREAPGSRRSSSRRSASPRCTEGDFAAADARVHRAGVTCWTRSV